MNKIKERMPASNLWSYQTDLLAIASRWLIVIVLAGAAVNSLWFLWDPFWRTFSQNTAMLLMALLGWLCLGLARRGHFYPAVRLFVGAGFGVAMLITATVGEQFVANGTFLLAWFMLIGVFLLPAHESRFWIIGAIVAVWLALTGRYSLPLPGSRIAWPDLIGTYLFSALVLAAFGLLGRNIIGRLNVALAESRAARQQLQASLSAEQASEDRYRTIFSVSPDLIYLTDLQGNLLDANPALQQQVGMSLADMQKLNVADFFAGPDPTSLLKAMANMQHGQPIYGLQIQAGVAANEMRDFEINAIPVSEAGKITTVLSMARDITERNRAEESLRQKESYQRALLDNFPFLVWLKDTAGSFLAVNQAFAVAAGFDEPAQLQGKTDMDAWPPDLAEAYRADDRTVIESSRPKAVEEKVEAQGERKWFETYKAPVQADNGHLLGTVGFARDITERKQVQAALQKRLKYEKLLGEISAAAVKTDNPDRLQQKCVALMAAALDVSRIHILVYNPVAKKVDNTVEWTAPDVAPGQENLQALQAAAFSWWKELFENHQVFQCEDIENIPGEAEKELLRALQVKSILIVPLLTATGMYGLIGFNECRVKRAWPEGDVQLLLAAARIIGGAIERQRAMFKLEQSEENYRRLFDNATDAIYIRDRLGRFLDVNQGAVNMYGYPKEFFVGKTPEVLSAPGKNNMAQVGEYVEKAFAGEVQQFEFWGLRSNGEIFPKIVRFQKSEYFGQEVLIVFAIDISDYKNIEQQLVRQERLAAVGQLAAGIAHDFNNILTSILGFAELLHFSPDTPAKMKPKLQHIITSSRRAANLIRQILDFSGKTIRHTQQLELSSFVAETVTFLRTTLPESIQIKTRFETGNFMTEADPTQLQQLLTNLAVNARDAMPGGGVLKIGLARVEVSAQIHCAVCNEPITGGWIKLEITDTGTGIPAELLPRIFEPFFTTKEVGKGSGLGLSQVAGIVKQHSGYITVTSRAGRDTTFTIYLPAEVSGCVLPTLQPLSMVSGKKETILLVEDEPTVLEATTAMLQYQGYQTIAAANGQQAITLFKAHKQQIALVISDMVMPDMDGEMLFHRLKTDTPQLKMVMMSGYPLGEKGTKLLDQGMVAWFQKPMSFAELSQVVSQALSGKKGRWE